MITMESNLRSFIIGLKISFLFIFIQMVDLPYQHLDQPMCIPIRHHRIHILSFVRLCMHYCHHCMQRRILLIGHLGQCFRLQQIHLQQIHLQQLHLRLVDCSSKLHQRRISHHHCIHFQNYRMHYSIRHLHLLSLLVQLYHHLLH